MTVDMLRYSKIGERIQNIQRNGDVLFEDKFHYHERAKALVEQWSRLDGLRIDEFQYAKGSDGFRGFTDMDAISPILHDVMRSRKRCVGADGGLEKVIVEDGSGRATVVTLPFPYE